MGLSIDNRNKGWAGKHPEPCEDCIKSEQSQSVLETPATPSTAPPFAQQGADATGCPGCTQPDNGAEPYMPPGLAGLNRSGPAQAPTPPAVTHARRG